MHVTGASHIPRPALMTGGQTVSNQTETNRTETPPGFDELLQTLRHTDTQIRRHTNTQTHIQTERQTERQRERQASRLINRHIDRQTNIIRNTM